MYFTRNLNSNLTPVDKYTELRMLFFATCLLYAGPALGGAGPNWELFQSAQVPSQLAPRSVELGAGPNWEQLELALIVRVYCAQEYIQQDCEVIKWYILAHIKQVQYIGREKTQTWSSVIIT